MRRSRVPFSLGQKVEGRLTNLLEQDIVERSDGLSLRVSPVVIVNNPNGDVRLIVDMRQANTAVVREQYPIPTVDEILQSLNGSKVFSKLDLKWRFHQVELHPDSHGITTFAANDGLHLWRRQ